MTYEYSRGKSQGPEAERSDVFFDRLLEDEIF